MRTRGFRSPRLLPAAALATAGLLAFSACGAEETPDPETTSPTELSQDDEQTDGQTEAEDPPIEAPELSAEDADAADETSEWDTEPKTTGLEASPGAELSVTDIRVGVRENADRVVFELEGTGTPGYEVAYVPEPHQQGSGFPVDVPGDAFLQVQLSGQMLPTESGSPEAPVGTVSADQATTVAGVNFSGQFEGVAQSFVGLSGGERPFTAFLVENPTRLVIDIQH